MSFSFEPPAPLIHSDHTVSEVSSSNSQPGFFLPQEAERGVEALRREAALERPGLSRCGSRMWGHLEGMERSPIGVTQVPRSQNHSMA